MAKYAESRDSIRTGDLLAWSHRGIKSFYDFKVWLVRLFTQSEYTHVGVAGAARDLAADLRIGSKRMSGAAYFDLMLAENIVTVQGLATALLLDAPQQGGATRAGEILKTPVSDPGELPGSIRVAYGLPEIPQ